MNSKDVSESHTASKRRLQAKAKDIEESAAYSENFEEESLAKSATAVETSERLSMSMTSLSRH